MVFYLIIILLTLLYCVVTKKYEYFKKKKIPHLKPTFLFGNYKDFIIQKKSMAEVVQNMCEQFPDEKFIGAYYATEPVLIPIDPDTIKSIMTKDFYYFNARELCEHNQKEPAALNIFATYGDNWKVLRQNMTPLFSSAKMRNMFHLIQKCCYIYESMIENQVKISKELEVRDMTAKFTIDCIGACVFGLDANTMTDDPNSNPFVKIGTLLKVPPKEEFYKRLFRSIWPGIFYFLGYELLTAQINFFQNLFTSIMIRRNYQPSGQNNFVDLLLSWKQNNHIIGESMKSFKWDEVQKVSLKADDDLLVAQCFVFFAAGFGTSSSTLSYTLYELAKHPEIQNKVLEEVDTYMKRHHNKLVYECVSELPYLEAVIDETLRIYPVLGVITREQTEDYTFPNGVRTKKGTRIHVPVLYLQHNPKYFPDPDKFQPERFYGEAKKKINPYTYMPFGEGPRICIGMRFAKMKMLAGLITMLKRYRLELADGMPMKLQFKPQPIVTHPIGDIKLKFIERDGWQDKVFVQ